MNRRRSLVDGIAAVDEALRRGHELTSAVLGDVDRVAGVASGSTTRRLYSMVGAGFGGLGAVSIGMVTSLAVIPVLFPLLLVSGGAVGALMWNGRKTIRIEKHLHQRETVLKSILSDIKSLPRNAPESVREALWEQYTLAAAYVAPDANARPSLGSPGQVSDEGAISAGAVPQLPKGVAPS
jgi:hypothetical protein